MGEGRAAALWLTNCNPLSGKVVRTRRVREGSEQTMKVSVISPTFNESANVSTLIERIGEALRGVDYEIVIVDDNSPDLTWSVVEDIAKTNPRVRVIRRMENPGLGFAVLDGFSAATGEAVACIDADLQHDPSKLREMFEEIQGGADFAVGSRYVEGGGTGDWNLLRRFESWLATKIAQISLGVKLKDPMSGFFMMKRADFAPMRSKLNGSGFKIMLEICACLRPKNVKEVPYDFRARLAGESKLSSKVVIQYLGQVWRLSKLGQRCSTRFLKFGIVGATGVLVNLAVLTALFKMVGFRDWGASAVASCVANLSNYALNNLWTFADRAHKEWAVVRGYVSYFLMSLVGMAITTAIYTGLVWGIGRVWPATAVHSALSTAVVLSSQFIGILVGMFSNYELNKNVTWGKVIPLLQSSTR